MIVLEHRFDSWVKMKEYAIEEAAPCEQAIRDGDAAAVARILRETPELLGGKIAWQDCRGERTLLWYATWCGSAEVVEAVVESGYDLNRDGPEAIGMALTRSMYAVADALVERGVEALENQMVLFQLSEDLNSDGLRWMLDRGADADYRNSTKEGGSWTPLDNAIHTYPPPAKRRQETVRVLLDAGAAHEASALFDLLSGDVDRLRRRIETNRGVLNAPFDIGHNREQSLEFGGQYGGAPLKNTTLLHHCAEFGFEDEARLLIDLGADVDARATPDGEGFSTHTPLFHTLTTNCNNSFGVLELLLENGASATVEADLDLFVWDREHRGQRFRLRGVTLAAYIEQFPNDYWKSSRRGDLSSRQNLDTEPHPEVVDLLRRHGG